MLQCVQCIDVIKDKRVFSGSGCQPGLFTMFLPMPPGAASLMQPIPQAHGAVQTSANSSGPEEFSRLADIYTLLAQLMRYPEDAAVLTLQLEAALQLTSALSWRDETEYLREWLQQCPDLCSVLRLEYTRLFITAPRRSTVPPYASVHLDDGALLQGRTTQRIHDFYRGSGYELAAVSEPADHISLQLDFLAALARDGRIAEEEQFLDTFFRPWFAIFKEKCFQATAHPVYRLALTLIDFFTKEEQ